MAGSCNTTTPPNYLSSEFKKNFGPEWLAEIWPAHKNYRFTLCMSRS